MQRIYEAANNIEAHMLVHLLQQAGVEAHVEGEHLQSGGGELPLSGLVAVVVSDDRARQAREIIRDWEASTQQPRDPMQPASANRGLFGPMLAFILGALVGATVISSLSPSDRCAEDASQSRSDRDRSTLLYSHEDSAFKVAV